MDLKALISAVAVALLSCPVGAEQPESLESSEPDALSKTRFELSFGGTWAGKADLDASPGELGVARVGSQLSISHRLNETLGLEFGFEAEYSVYDFDNASGLVSGTSDPFDDATILSLSLGASIRAGEHNTWFITGLVESSGESGAPFDESITGGGIVAFRHEFSDRLTLGIGVAAQSRLEDDVYVIPVPIVRWQINDRWSLETGRRANLRLVYEPSDRWRFGAEAAWERREFRLDDQGPLPSGVAEERAIPVGLFAQFTPSANVVFDARVGSALGRELQIDNASGVRVADEDIDPAIYAGLNLSVRF
ncbi:MAG: hypothetical protein Kow0022_08140 [Phycisphaerales bacterium]